MNPATEAANLLLTARRTRQRPSMLPEYCRPADTDAAYAIQDLLVSRLIDGPGGRPIGYKIGCTNEKAQRFLDISGPFHGRLLEHYAHRSPLP